MDVNAEFRRCLIELDVAGMRRIHSLVMPHLPEPKTDEDMMLALHLARVRAKSIHPKLKLYSRHWLRERETGRIALGIGVAVKVMNPSQKARGQSIQHEMNESILASVREGLDLDKDADEVKRRMMEARKRG